MKYTSTRDSRVSLTAAEAILQGLSREGGLLLPEEIPTVTEEQMNAWQTLSYPELAASVLKLFLPEFSEEELSHLTKEAYSSERFDTEEIAPVSRLSVDTFILELWHGPTCAFKDMALQVLPRLITASRAKTGQKENICILTATSGDTGKAALEGFRDVPGTKIIVYYPKDGVSDIQKLQMVTQSGDNVNVIAVHGNFDDAQSGVKRIFSDSSLRERLQQHGWVLSSANSINWGRVLPQIVYYFGAYFQLVNKGVISQGDPVNFCVPTGNFGDILAGYYAREMGLPVHKLICASNSNNVLTDFIKTGVYNRNREFFQTISPSMDILVSSNLERLLYLLSGSDQAVQAWMQELQDKGQYDVGPEMTVKIQDVFSCGWCSDTDAEEIIARVFGEEGYLLDPHSADALKVLFDYRKRTGDTTVAVSLSTASPFKFCASVLDALGVAEKQKGTHILGQLQEKTGWTVPKPLALLEGKPLRFAQEADKNDLQSTVEGFLL